MKRRRVAMIRSIFTAFAKVRVWGFSGIRCYVKDRLLYWRTARRLRRIARLDTDTAPERGLTLIGNFTGASSNCKTNRDFACSLRDAGIPFQTFDIGDARMIPSDDYRQILTPSGEFRLRRYSHVVEMFRSPLPRELVQRRARIAFWEGEHGILDVWPFLSGTDPVIGMSDFNVAYFRKALPEAKTYKILYPLRKVDVELPPSADVRRRFGFAADDFIVFFNFDFGSYHRKNPKSTLRAFARGLADRPKARLVFKTMNACAHPGQLSELRELADALGVADRFTVITDYLPHADLYALTAACDVYISLHRGEGFGIGMAEAMLFGKPVVATDWSASTEFVQPGAAVPIPYTLVPVRPEEYFVAMKEWAEADVDAAAVALRRLHDDPSYRVEIGECGRRFVENHFSLANFKASVEGFLNDL